MNDPIHARTHKIVEELETKGSGPQPQIIKVNDNVFVGHKYSLSNIMYIITATSVIVIDTGESLRSAENCLKAFRQISDLPISHIIYTHHHGDHIRGANALRMEDTRIISQRNLPQEYATGQMLLPYRTRVDRLQFGLKLEQSLRGISHAPRGETGYVPPDMTFDREHSFQEGGVKFRLYHAPGESLDHTAVWLPKYKTLFPGDLFYHSFPMLSNPMKPDRPVLAWAESLDHMRSLGPQYLVPSHGLPITGTTEVETALLNYAGAIRYVHDRTVSLINRGFDLHEIKKRVRLPAQWRMLPYLQPRYGCVEWAISGIFRQYTGWYNLNPTNIDPISRPRLHKELVALSGGIGPLVKRAIRAIQDGDDQLCLELTDIVLDASPHNNQALNLRAQSLERLGQATSNSVACNLYRTAALSIRGRRPLAKKMVSSRSAHRPPVFILAAPRSFTSVITAMLGQHPELYGLPELHLFGSQTLSDWLERCRTETFPFAHGLLRAIAQLYFGEQTDRTVELAWRWLKARSYLSTGLLMRMLCARVYPAAVVEKSPNTSDDQKSLNRMYQMFPHARFIHLVRHPKGQGLSILNYLKVRAEHGSVPPSHWLARMASFGAGKKTELDPQWGWLALNQHICAFLRSVPAAQQWTIRGEDLLSEPTKAFPPILEWLGIRSGPRQLERMKHPEDSPFAFLGPPGAEYGNDRFFLQKPEVRDVPCAIYSLQEPAGWLADQGTLAPDVIEMAKQFGYVA